MSENKALILGIDGTVISTPQPGLWLKMENRIRTYKHENRLLQDKLKKIALLHCRVRDGGTFWCKTCGEDWPCPTEQILQSKP